MRHLYPFLFRSFSLWGRKDAIRRPSDVEIREEVTKRSDFRSLREQSNPPMSQRGFLPGHFCTMLWSSSAKMPTPKHKPEEAQLSVGFFLVG